MSNEKDNKGITSTWWYIQLWKLNKLRKKPQYYVKNTYKAFSERKNKDKFVENDYDIGNGIKLYYWRYDENNEHNENLGDYLSKIIVDYFKPKNIECGKEKKNKTLYAIGSILGFRCQDAVVWGSGLLSENSSYTQRARFSSLDIRAVRGPKTRKKLLKLGKKCPEVYGDPAILMPQIYMPGDSEKKYDVSVVLHYKDKDMFIPDDVNKIDIITNDYEKFIDEIVQSKLIISSSLHGIILAEAYGVPAIYLNKDATSVSFKYEDWYNSTGRYDIVWANSFEQALKVKPMELPDLKNMQQRLLDSFPYDLWS